MKPLHLKIKNNHYTIRYFHRQFLFGYQALSQEYTHKFFYFWPFELEVCENYFYQDFVNRD